MCAAKKKKGKGKKKKKAAGDKDDPNKEKKPDDEEKNKQPVIEDHVMIATLRIILTSPPIKMFSKYKSTNFICNLANFYVSVIIRLRNEGARYDQVVRDRGRYQAQARGSR